MHIQSRARAHARRAIKTLAAAAGIVFIALFAVAAHARPAGLIDTADLPLIEVPAVGLSHGEFAIMVSGDGGWRAIDQHVSAYLSKAGVPVVGLISPSYLRSRRTPEEAANALERIMRRYEVQWKADRVLLIGYSRGAGMLPFMISRLSPQQRAHIERVALLGLDDTIDFKFNTRALLWNAPDERQIPVRPEVEKLRGLNVLCFRGETELDSACRDLPPSLATEVVEPGGHHFAGNYDVLARRIAGSGG
jgi:type IV secretory pathway VirJ component